jgi:NAD(P)-dependent dehydrogenase (short-subunit alcohol dehydrogenase family)
MNPTTAVVIGANSVIGQAFVREILEADPKGTVVAISRGPCPPALQCATGEAVKGLLWLRCDNSSKQIADVVQQLSQPDIPRPYSHIVICQGILHDRSTRPEKRLEDITAETLQHIFNINTVIPTLWLQQLLALVKGKQPTRIALLSARIGSISDNRLGGWYSYRASKAALNMLIQTASIEYARRAPNVKLLSFHPGTTDSPLSKPFQKSVAPEKLFSAQFVAKQLLRVMNDCPIDGLAAYRDWDNQTISW